jgi:hypothetical protein
MRRFVVTLALTACSESPEDRLDRLVAQSDIRCWSHDCDDGPGATFPLPPIPTEQGAIGPLRVGLTFCAARDPNGPGFIEVTRPAVDGCAPPGG